jgi:hypothetical protein
MALRDRVRRLQKLTEAPSDVLVLQDGSKVVLAPGERYEAYLAAYSGDEHPLLDLIEGEQIDLERSSPELREYTEFIRAFGTSRLDDQGEEEQD